jgi:hypothetical protein
LQRYSNSFHLAQAERSKTKGTKTEKTEHKCTVCDATLETLLQFCLWLFH